MQKGDHGSTFAGGPFVTHVAKHVVQRVAQPEFLADVRAKGELLRELIEEINSPHMVAVRGEGLMVGVELDIEAAPVIAKGYEHGVLIVSTLAPTCCAWCRRWSSPQQRSSRSSCAWNRRCSLSDGKSSRG